MKRILAIGLLLVACGGSKGTDLSGTWNSDFGVMELTQEDGKIRGTYNQGLGEISGQLRGDTVFFTWKEAEREGTGYWVVADQGRQLVGKYRNGNQGPWMGYWRAKRQESN